MLQNKKAIITGGASGIGAQAVRLFQANGADVVIADMNEAMQKKGLGLSSIASRVEFMKGKIDWDSVVGEGTTCVLVCQFDSL